MALTKVHNRLIDGARINVKDFGAVGDGVADDTAAIQAAIDYLDTGSDTVSGGTVFIPRGTYIISSTINIDGGASNIASIALVGDGMHNTVLQCAAGFTGNDAVKFVSGGFCKVEELFIKGTNNVDYGLTTEDFAYNIRRVNIEDCVDSCFNFTGFMGYIQNCRSKGGIYGFNFANGFNTSVVIDNCYANNTTSTTTGAGFNLVNMAYSFVSGCAADFCFNGYYVFNLEALTLVSCGAERAYRSAFAFSASSSGNTHAKAVQCYSTECNTGGENYGTVYSEQLNTGILDVTIDGFWQNPSITYGGPSVSTNNVKTDHTLRLVDCTFPFAVHGDGVIYDSATSISVGPISITGSNTPVLDIQSVNKSNNQYSGILHVIAQAADFSETAASNTAAYVLLVTKSPGSSSVVEIAKNGLISGGSANHPSFTWSIDTANNDLEATPVGSSTGNFYFYITKVGGLI